MYNHQLDVFVKTAERSSFSEAAQALYVTPSAVIQQIKNLEERLDIRLFDRSSRGVSLTPAGKYLYKESKKFIQKSNMVLTELECFKQENEKKICVATNVYHCPQMLYDMWVPFQEIEPDCKLIAESFSGKDSVETTRVDIVEGLYFHEKWHKNFSFLQLKTVPVQVGVFGTEPLVEKNRITYKDLKEVTVVTIRRGMEDTMDHILDELIMRGIRVIPVDIYDHAAIITLCAARQYVILLPQCWKNMFENMTLIDCEWEYTIPYGFFISPMASVSTKRFVEFLQQKQGN